LSKLELIVSGCEGRDSRSRSTGGRLLHGWRSPGAEAVADGLGQARLIHLPFYTGDNHSFSLDPAFLFHETAVLRTMNYRIEFEADLTSGIQQIGSNMTYVFNSQPPR